MLEFGQAEARGFSLSSFATVSDTEFVKIEECSRGPELQQEPQHLLTWVHESALHCKDFLTLELHTG